MGFHWVEYQSVVMDKVIGLTSDMNLVHTLPLLFNKYTDEMVREVMASSDGTDVKIKLWERLEVWDAVIYKK